MKITFFFFDGKCFAEFIENNKHFHENETGNQIMPNGEIDAVVSVFVCRF